MNRLPPCVAQIMAAMNFSARERQEWNFSEGEWKAALYFLDRNQMALLARFLLGTEFPEAVRRRIDSDYAINRARLTRIREMYAEAARALTARGLDWTLLKGSAGVDEYYADPDSRVQYDLDLYCPLTPQRAQEALLELGYHPSAEASPSADHLPPLARETGWTWQGDFFDPSIPIAIEVNFRLWDEQTERMAAPGVEKFWERRRGDVLDPADALAHKALHLLRHLLRGEFRAAHLYEIAWFLHHHAAADSFWQRGHELHQPGLRRLEAIAFGLAQVWFGPRMAAIVQQEIERLPEGVTRWIRESGWSPAESYFHPNKEELWLHLRLLDSVFDKARVLRRRLIPATLPHSPLRTRSERVRFLCSRAWFHARTLGPSLSKLLRG